MQDRTGFFTCLHCREDTQLILLESHMEICQWIMVHYGSATTIAEQYLHYCDNVLPTRVVRQAEQIVKQGTNQ